jgi:hypothetical protein
MRARADGLPRTERLPRADGLPWPGELLRGSGERLSSDRRWARSYSRGRWGWSMPSCPARAGRVSSREPVWRDGAAGHMAVFCNAVPGCRSVWYRPRCEWSTRGACPLVGVGGEGAGWTVGRPARRTGATRARAASAWGHRMGARKPTRQTTGRGRVQAGPGYRCPPRTGVGTLDGHVRGPGWFVNRSHKITPRCRRE